MDNTGSALSSTNIGPSTPIGTANNTATSTTASTVAPALGSGLNTSSTINASGLGSTQPVTLPTAPTSTPTPAGQINVGQYTALMQNQGLANNGQSLNQPTNAGLQTASGNGNTSGNAGTSGSSGQLPQTTPVSTSANPFAAANTQNTGLTSGNPQGLVPFSTDLQNESNAQNQYDQTTQQINSLMQELGMQQSDTTNMQTQANIPGLQNNLSELNTQYAQAQAAYQQQYQTIGGQNIPSLFVTGQEAIAKAAANSNLGSLSAQIQAAQGNITSAFNTINQTIKEKYDPIQQQLTAQETFLKDNYDQLTAQQKIVADATSATIASQSANIKNEQTVIASASATISDAVTKLGLDPQAAIKALGALASGSETLDQIGTDLGIAFNSDGTSDSVTVGSGAGTGATNTASILGTVDPTVGALTNMTTPMSTVVQNYGIDNVVQAIIQQEGSQLDPSLNNPGDVKYYAGMPNATNSGIAASDGGTWAKFDTLADGTQAVAQTVQSAIAGTTTAYGTDPTFQDFMNKYTNTAPTSDTSTPSYQQYGLLANTDFNPNSKTDNYAQQYLTSYLKNGTLPTAASLGLSLRGGNVGAISATTILQNAQKRASDLYFQATGQQLPNLGVLKSNTALVASNNTLLNQLNVQTGTIQKNFGLNLENLTQNNVNSSWPVINNVINSIASATGSTSIAQYLSQNQTLTNELASLLAVKNASGTTVADKLSSTSILPPGATVAQAKVILSTLMNEANNQSNTINQTNAGLYKSIDPLEQDPNNPNLMVSTPGGNQVPQMVLNSAKSNNFDIDGAIKAGYTVPAIESYLQGLYGNNQ